MKSLWDRFEPKIAYEPMSGCWLWTGALTPGGYGVIGTRGSRTSLAHRISYMMLVGDPGDLPLDHWCKNTWCVNPDHLRVLSWAESGSLTSWRAKTHCPAKHEYTPENTYRRRSGGRECRKCMKRRHRKAPSQQPEYRRKKYAAQRG